MPYINCEICRKEKYKKPAELKNARFCSYDCKYEAQRLQSPEQHGRWMGGSREKECVGCAKTFTWMETVKNGKRLPLTTWNARKYCTLECSRKYQSDYVLSGKDHPRWKNLPEEEKAYKQRDRSKKIYKDWRNAVFIRDDYTCQFCNKRGGYIEADHIKGWSEFPELRFEVDNGRTLCRECHKKTFKFHRNQYSK